MSQWTGDALRRAALDALGPQGDVRARDALVHGALEVTSDVARWQASRGPFEGVGVTLWLDGERLDRIAAAPAVNDVLRAAIAAAVATRTGESLFELTLGRAPGGTMPETPYRGRL
jgi:hypothetical protein